MSQITEKSRKIIDEIYKLNPDLPLEVLVLFMVSQGIREGMQMSLDVLNSPEAAQLLSHKHTLTMGEINDLIGKIKQ